MPDVMVQNIGKRGTVSIKNLIDTVHREVDNMKLILNQYLEADPPEVAERLEAAVLHGIDAAATRIDVESADVSTEPLDEGLRVHGGLQILDGSELRIADGGDGLTILEFEVPWANTGRIEAKLLAANAFAHTVAREVDPVAA